MKAFLAGIIVICISFSSYAQKDSIAVFYSGFINAKQINKYMNKLTSEEFAGRETGEPGQKLAAEYIAEEFKKSGVKPGNGDSYFQYYDLKITSAADIEIEVNGTKYNWLIDYYTYYSTSDQEIKKDTVLFLGYGLEEKRWNDVKALNIKNKAVLVLEGEPKNRKGNYYLTGTKEPSKHISGNRAKIRNLKTHSPAVIFIVTDNIEKNVKKYNEWINRNKAELVEQAETTQEPPTLFISFEMANELLKSKEINFDKLTNQMKKKGKPISFYTYAKQTVKVKNNSKNVQVENVLSSVMAKEKTDEWIVLSAHYDHLGIKEEGIYYGADDNASGTSAIMMLAHTFSEMEKAGHAPKRNLLFMCVSGEEKGLLGSSYYVKNPVVPLENTVCNLNIDMIGRVDEDHSGNENYVYVIGADKLSSELQEISAKTAKLYTNLELDYKYNDPNDPNRFYSRSDHYNFAKNNIPVIFYFNGVHKDYHEVTDTIDKISFNKVENICKFVFFTAYELANRQERITVDKKEAIDKD